MKECYKSSEIARRLNMQHVRLLGTIRRVQSSLDKIEKDESSPFQSMATGFKAVEKQSVYRGQKFTYYAMNRQFLLLLLTRVKSNNSLEIVITLFTDMLSSDIFKGEDSDTLYLMMSALNVGSKQPEKIFKRYIVSNFKRIFRGYTLISEEYKLPDGDRIDLLAEETKTGRDVVIEIKPKPVSAHKQLRSYGYYFENPILINVTPSPVKSKADGIKYVVCKNYKDPQC